jgi:hypothetical protein
MKPYRKLFYTTKGESLLQLCKMEEQCGLLSTSNGVYLYEDVVSAEPELSEMKEIVNDSRQQIFDSKDLNQILHILNTILLNRKIKFYYNSRVDDKVYLIGAGYNAATNFILISCTNKVTEFYQNRKDKDILFKNFLGNFYRSIGHELIHRYQALKIEYEEKRKEVCKKSNEYGKKYLSNKHEIMSYAWQIVNNFRMEGIKDNEIKGILKTDSNIKKDIGGQILKDYHNFFKLNDGNNILKSLYKYMYMYLDK